MAEPKGGPVKPPTLDLKPRQASTGQSGKSRVSTAKKSGVKTPPPPGAQQNKRPKASAPSSQKTGSAQKSTADTSDTVRSSARKSTSAQSPRPAQPSPSSPDSASSNRTGPNPANPDRQHKQPVHPKSWMTPILAAILGAVGGAVLSLLVIIPLIMSGIFQPDTQSQTRAQIKALEENLSATQDLSNRNLREFSGLNEQIGLIRQALMEQNSATQNQLNQLEQNQQELGTRQTVQETTITEQLNSLAAQIQTITALEPAPATTPFDPSPLRRQIADLDAKMEAIAAGASNEDAQKLSADIAQMHTRLNAVQTELEQQIQNWNTQFVQLDEKLDAQNARFETISTLIAQNSNQLEQQDLSLAGLSLSTAELMKTTNELQLSTQEIAEAVKTAQMGNDQNKQVTANQVAPPLAQVQQIPFALMSIEIALNNGQPFLYQLESLAAQTNSLETSPELLHAAADGLAIPDEIAAEFDRLIPVVLSARPSNPDASYLERIGDSIKSILGLRATGLENGDEFENLLNQSLAAIKVSDFTKAQTLLDDLPPNMRAHLGELNQQIKLHARIQSIMSALSAAQQKNTTPPANTEQPDPAQSSLPTSSTPAPAPQPTPEPEPTLEPAPETKQEPTPPANEVSQ
ncbi:MAG TPA: hypothetical protein ENK61_08465 [Devosia sp.]|nr:hypothetical protein [Devosia sp.]